MVSNRMSGTIPSQLTNNRTSSLLIGNRYGHNTNSLSGTLPIDVFLASNLDFGSNEGLSGTLPSGVNITQVTASSTHISGTLLLGKRLANFYCSQCKLLGTLQTDFYFNADWPAFSLSNQTTNTAISGVLPAHFTGMGGGNGRLVLDLSLLRLSGSVTPSMRNVQLLLLNLHSNVNLQFGIGALLSGSMPFVETIMAQGCSIRGQLPENIGALIPSIQSLVVSDQEISGTIPASITALTELESLIVANQKISGTIPKIGCHGAFQNLIALSGSLPKWSNNEFQVIAVARNYLTGKTDSLSDLVKLRTLILTENRFSCNAARLDSAVELATGDSCDPLM